jgi:transglutaminase/protease-like cytokinesis protein 3
MAHASGRRSVLSSLHQNDEGKTSGIIGFKFLPQPTLPFISDRTDMLASKFKGGFTPKVSHFGSSSASVSQTSNPSQVPATPSASSDVLDVNRTSKPTENVAKPLQQTSTPSASLKFGSGSAVSNARNLYSSSENVSRSSKCLTEVESSALEVLEGLDSSSLFDDF